jgi:hypothetical protein
VAVTAAAAGAAATANADRDMSRGAPERAPRLASVLVGTARVVLGAAGVGGSVSLGLSFATAVAEAGLGAGLTIFALVVPGGRQRPWRLAPPRPQARRSWWRTLFAAMFPSTYGVAVLTAIALVFDASLAALLAGVLLGMGALALAHAVLPQP